MLFVSDKLEFVPDEMSAYMWKRDAHDVPQDEPIDDNDHSLDTIKYMLSEQPEVGTITADLNSIPAYMTWREAEIVDTISESRDMAKPPRNRNIDQMVDRSMEDNPSGAPDDESIETKDDTEQHPIYKKYPESKIPVPKSMGTLWKSRFDQGVAKLKYRRNT